MTGPAWWPASADTAPLAPQEICRFLLDRGLLRAADMVDAGIEVVDASRAHLVHLVTVGGTHGFAVKQARAENPAGGRDIERERAVYAIARGRAGLAEVMPAWHADDPGLLVLERVRPGDTLLARSHAAGADPELAALLGAAIASWHGDTRDLEAAALPPEVPWVLTLFEPGRSEFAWHHPAMAQTLASLSAGGGFEAALREARENWRPACLVHGDLKWDNCLVDERGPARRLRVIDWELACLGDPAWDLAGGLADALLFEASDGSADAGTPAVGAAAEALWAAYRDAAAFGTEETLLERSVSFAGARLVQTCLEYANQQGAGSPGIGPVADLAMRLLHEPEAIVEGLGARSVT